MRGADSLKSVTCLSAPTFVAEGVPGPQICTKFLHKNSPPRISPQTTLEIRPISVKTYNYSLWI